MTFADQLKKASTPKPRARCALSKVRAVMTADDRADLDAAIADRDITVNAIVAALAGLGFTAGTRHAIARHRNNECTWCNWEAAQ